MKFFTSLVYSILYILNNISHRKVRTWLSVIAIVIGISSILLLVSLSSGLNKVIKGEFEKLGKDNIIVKPGGVLAPIQADISLARLEDKDLKVIKQVKGVKYATGFLIKRANIEFKGERKSLNVMGVIDDKDTKDIMGSYYIFDILEGRDIKSKYDAVLGYKTANNLFKKKIKIGDKIKINNTRFKVVGIQRKSGSRVHDYYIKINLDGLKEIITDGEHYSMLFVKVDEHYDVNKVVEKIKLRLRKTRNVKENNEDFNIESVTKIAQTFTSIISIINAVLIAIASISLVVGGVGIMNTTFTAVLQRTKEIAIMKAIGAKNYYVLLLFCFESGMISLVGGIIGIIIGVILSKIGAIIINSYQDVFILVPVLSFNFIIFLVIFSFLVGFISALIPGIKAARLKPIEGLRYE